MSDRLESLIPPVIRVLVERTRAGQWQAFTVEFGLAVQGESHREVREKLLSMVESYVNEALTVDRDYAPQLLRRKATLSIRARVAFFVFLTRLHVSFKKLGFMAQTFEQPTPALRRCHG